VLVPTSEFVQKLVAARLAADVCGVDTLLIARTDANSATLLTSDADEYDRQWCTGERTTEGFLRVRDGVGAAMARALAYAPYADLLWFETAKPDLAEARAFAEAIHAKHPGKLLAYNCSPSFNWKRHLSEGQMATFQADLGSLGYKFQFVTLSAFHALNLSMFQLARDYKTRGMAAYADLQSREFAAEGDGYRGAKHQEFVGVGYFDDVAQVVAGGQSSTTALEGSTEQEQFARR
jgi:isocitrate lyase